MPQQPHEPSWKKHRKTREHSKQKSREREREEDNEEIGEASGTSEDTATKRPKKEAPSQPHRQHNRVRAIMAHGWRYAFQPTDRLAQDVGVSPRTIRRLLSGETAHPPFALVEAVTDALSKDLRLPFPLSVREVFSADGTYPTTSTCDLCDCGGCLPENAFDRYGTRRPEQQNSLPGDWCRFEHWEQEGEKDIA
jgi:hypothetical protein